MSRTHECPWPGCQTRVPSWQWGCRDHFKRLPEEIRFRLIKLRRWWPEAKAARADADRAARRIAREDAGPPKCRTCGAPAAARLPLQECLDCHRSRIMNQARQLGEKPDE